MSKYLYDYDDPYKVLAHSIIGNYRPSDVVRILTDNSYIKSCMIREARAQDIGGIFIDCTIEDILDKKKRMEYMQQLDSLGVYFYSQIDKNRLRKELASILEEAGIDLSEIYSTEGNVLSANT